MHLITRALAAAQAVMAPPRPRRGVCTACLTSQPLYTSHATPDGARRCEGFATLPL